ncbi:T6SS immunity protein Tli4 family protein [Burkholderia territorii]|uniref:T6SS immunity protein Tli4 family protein n=1 Tax=Burkholderia territorii TaxID=1503055 RepID=UPI000A99573A|nr:T6SS immunity protein Tli4 family protein [Burkholderia territorii]
MRNPLRAWILLLTLLSVAACGRQTAYLTDQEKQNVNELTRNLKAYCVGRYLIDMPSDVLLSGGATVDGVEIESTAMSHIMYFEEMKKRSAELRGKKTVDTYPFLYADDMVDGHDTHYFIYRGDVRDDPGRRIIEAYKWSRGYRFKLTIEGVDFTNPDQTNDPIVKTLTVKNDIPEKTRLVFDIIKRIRGREEDEIPTDPGLCFLGGFLPGKAGGHEEVGAQFVFARNRDVSIRFSSDSGIRETNSLLQRGDQIDAGLKSMKGGRSIRKGTVELEGIRAEEWLIGGETAFGVPGNVFTLEANSMTSNAQSPLLTLDMSTGSSNAFLQEPIKMASLSESEAIAVWDVISRSLRPRPNGF